MTASFTTGYVSSLGIGMAAGRFGWSNTYAVFGLGIPVVGMLSYLAHDATETAFLGDSATARIIQVFPYLGAFYSGSILAITFMGGSFQLYPLTLPICLDKNTPAPCMENC